MANPSREKAENLKLPPEEFKKGRIPRIQIGQLNNSHIKYYEIEQSLYLLESNYHLYRFINNQCLEFIGSDNILEELGGVAEKIYPEDKDIYDYSCFPTHFIKKLEEIYKKNGQKFPIIDEYTILDVEKELTTPESKQNLIDNLKKDLEINNPILLHQIEFFADRNLYYSDELIDITLLCIHLIEKQIKYDSISDELNIYSYFDPIQVRYPDKKIEITKPNNSKK